MSDLSEMSNQKPFEPTYLQVTTVDLLCSLLSNPSLELNCPETLALFAKKCALLALDPPTEH